MSFFRILGPWIGIHGSFMMFLVFLVLFWSLLFGLLMFRKYFVAMFVYSCYVHSPWKCQLKNLFHSGDAFQYIFCMLVKENLWILPLRYVVLCLSLVLSVHLLLIFSERFWNHKLLPVLVIVISRKLSCLFSFSNSIVYWIDGSWLFRMSKNCNDCSLLLNLAWLSSTNLLKDFGAKLRVRACVIDMCSILWR